MDKRIKVEKRPAPQPVKICQERIDAILKDIREGGTRVHSAEANGIAYSTFYWWCEQGKCDLAHGVNSIEARLVKSLRKIERDEIKECRKSIAKQKRGHLGKQWTLERVYAKYFGPHAAVVALADEIKLEKERMKNEIRNKGRSTEGNIESKKE